VLPSYKQAAAGRVVSNAIRYSFAVCAKAFDILRWRNHPRLEFRQIDPTCDLARIQADDCNTILLPDVGVHLAVDEFEFVQPPYPLTGIDNLDLPLPLHCVRVQKSQQ